MASFSPYFGQIWGSLVTIFKKKLILKKKNSHKIFFLAEDVASMPSIDLTLKLQTTKPSGTIQTRKTTDLGFAPIILLRFGEIMRFVAVL